MSSTWMREKTWPRLSIRFAVPARSASKALRPGRKSQRGGKCATARRALATARASQLRSRPGVCCARSTDAAPNFRRPSRRRASRKPRLSTDSRAIAAGSPAISATWALNTGSPTRRVGSRRGCESTLANAASGSVPRSKCTVYSSSPSPPRVVLGDCPLAPSRRTSARAYNRGRSKELRSAPRSAGSCRAGAGSISSSEATIAPRRCR